MMSDSKTLVNLGQAALAYRDAVTGILEAEVLPSATMLHLEACVELADRKYNAAREAENRLPKLRKIRF